MRFKYKTLLMIKIGIVAIIAYFIFMVANQFSHLSICGDSLVPLLFYLLGVLVPIALVLFYAEKFPVMSIVASLFSIPVYTLLILYPQRFYVDTVVARICDAYNAEYMRWGNWNDYQSVLEYVVRSPGSNYIILFSISILVVLLAFLKSYLVLRQLRQLKQDSSSNNKSFNNDDISSI